VTLERILEPEAMDTADEAREYDAMDHSEVNRLFVDDLLAVGDIGHDILDLGTGTAQIPIELCQRLDECRVMAVDMATQMLELARLNIEIAGLIHCIQLEYADAKQLASPDDYFDVVMSNSIVHHVPEPLDVLREACRVARPGALLFFRDLMRPASEEELQGLVDTHAAETTDHQRQLFADSLRAALTVDEMRDVVKQLGFDADTVQATSDRHWTWIARMPAEDTPET
jgi:ubiquinone/menaquinone biosynthesis C-methylase UbiE